MTGSSTKPATTSLPEEKVRLSLLGLNVTAEDGREEMYRWYRLKGYRKTSGSIYRMSVVNSNGENVLENGRPKIIQVQGGREARLCRRAYVRGLKRLLKNCDIKVPYRKESDFHFITVLLILLAVLFFHPYFSTISEKHEGDVVSGKLSNISQVLSFSGDSRDLAIVTYIVFVLGIAFFGSTAILVFWLWGHFALQFYHTRWVTHDVRYLQFSSTGLTCMREGGAETFHDWKNLLAPKRFPARFQFNDGFKIYLPSDCRTFDLARIIYNIHHPPAVRTKTIGQFIWRVIVAIVFLAGLYVFVDYVFNAVDVDGRGLADQIKCPFILMAAMLVCMALLLAFIETQHPLFKRIRRRLLRWSERVERKDTKRR